MSILERLNLGLSRKLPLILQTEASECGLACLAMIAHHFGNETDLSELRRRFGASLKGVTLETVMRIADGIGFVTRPLRLELIELPRLRLPCVLHWDMNHFVVLESVQGDRLIIHDPAAGKRSIHMTEASRHFSGVALEFTPTSRFTTVKPQNRMGIAQLLGNFRGVKSALSKLFGLALAIEVFAMISPLFLGWVVDHALVSADRNLLLTLVLGFGLLLLLQTSIKLMRSWMLMGMNASLKVQARGNLFSHLQNLPASFFDTRHLGDVMSRFGSQETILQALTSEFVEALLDGLMATITVVIMFMLAPELASIVVAGAALYAILRWVSFAPLRRASAESLIWAARRDSHFLETLRGIRTIKLFNGQEARRVRWLNLLVETVNRQLTKQKLNILFRTANSLLLGLLMIIVIWIGATKILDGGFTVGLLIAFIAYKDQFLGRVSELINKIADFTMLKLDAERLSDIALTEPEEGGMQLPDLARHTPADIELRDISFRYGENEPLVLENVNLRISAGESIAIVGPSGGGKTTLLKLMAGLLQPTSGMIMVNGEPINQLGLNNYRSMLGVVMQDDQLFAGSIADNISFFTSRQSLEDIQACAKFAAIHDDVVAMPMGYGTLIGDMGTVLSGGQKQRVLIARALYRRPSVLLLDEATSHLDIKRERAVNDALSRNHVTRIVIAHRPETIRSAPRIITIDHGTASETGKSNFVDPKHINGRSARNSPEPIYS
jgi:ATP-binding cassette subfamily B protein RaxB